jgi:hypothetical protein
VLVRTLLVVLELTNSDVDVLGEDDGAVVAAAVELGDETVAQYSAKTVFESIVNVLDDLGVSIAQSGGNLGVEIVFIAHSSKDTPGEEKPVLRKNLYTYPLKAKTPPLEVAAPFSVTEI